MYYGAYLGDNLLTEKILFYENTYHIALNFVVVCVMGILITQNQK